MVFIMFGEAFISPRLAQRLSRAGTALCLTAALAGCGHNKSSAKAIHHHRPGSVGNPYESGQSFTVTPGITAREKDWQLHFSLSQIQKFHHDNPYDDVDIHIYEHDGSISEIHIESGPEGQGITVPDSPLEEDQAVNCGFKEDMHPCEITVERNSYHYKPKPGGDPSQLRLVKTPFKPKPRPIFVQPSQPVI